MCVLEHSTAIFAKRHTSGLKVAKVNVRKMCNGPAVVRVRAGVFFVHTGDHGGLFRKRFCRMQRGGTA